MPIYEYECTKCGHQFELIQKVDDPPKTKCEKCRGRAERLISSPAIQFKGSGWYVTDYARQGRSDSKAESDGSKKDSSSKKDTPSKKSAEKASSTTSATSTSK